MKDERHDDQMTKGSVLIISEKMSVCRLAGAKLAGNGYAVEFAQDGHQALAKIQNDRYDAVVLDFVMSGDEGLAILGQIKRASDDLPVIALTCGDTDEHLAEARLHGAAICVNRPFDVDSLVFLVEDTIESATPGLCERLPDSTRLFPKGQELALELIRDRKAGAHFVTVQGKNDQSLHVSQPIDAHGRGVHIPVRTPVRIGLAGSDAYYTFTTHVLEPPSDQHVLALEKPSVIYRIQRRQHQRFNVTIPLTYSIYSDESASEPEILRGETVDISLGGISFIAGDSVPPGELVTAQLSPDPHVGNIDVAGYVLRCEPCHRQDQEGFILRCKFTKIDAALAELLGM
jgi:CheY-like chemotaxis protein